MAKPERYLSYLADERKASRLYRALADLTTGDRREALLELADMEDRHAAHWIELAERAGLDVPEDDGTLEPSDADILRRARQMSLEAVLPELEEAEREAQGVYDDEPDALPEMADDERLHEQVLGRLRTGARAGDARRLTPDEARERLNQAEPWHRTDKSGSLRAAVFGVSDGLVSNTALVMGFAGSGAPTSTVAFAGLAGLLAGAFSMGAGEYVSVASQADLFKREIDLEARELREKPLEEKRELELIYRAKGLDKETARQTAERIMADPDTALDTLAREELGLDPDDLGSPYKVAGSSFLAFSVGAAVPLIPYLLFAGSAALAAAIAFAIMALALVGGAVGHLSGRGKVHGALRQLLVGGGAAAVTFAVGSLVGVTVG